MAKEPLRKCSHCGGVGHNMRTCDTLRGRNLGVRAQVLTKTSCSLESCDSLASENKGLTWSHEEHQRFLLGLTKYGKGEWKPISDHFVPSRTSAQVASHAQKHFKRLKSMKKQRPSLFDIPLRQQDRIRENIENRFQIHCSDSGGHPITPVSADLNSQNMGRYQESETPQTVSQAGIDIYNHFLSYCSTHQHYPTTPASADLNSQEMEKGLHIEQETEGNHPLGTSTITDGHMFTNTEDPITLHPSGKFQNETAEQDLLNQKLELH